MQNIRANVELAAQIVIAIAVLIVAGILIQRHVFPRRSNFARIQVGERLSVPNVDWKQNQKSLVFFLDRNCHFCTASAPFYRELIAEGVNRHVKSVAILPNTLDEARAYVRSLGLPIEDVRSGPISSYKVNGTPTLLLVDDNGMVRRAWFGASTGREEQIRDEFVAAIDGS